jgi:hypothetical protein
MGTGGRSWEMSRAVEPDCVNATMARALSSWAANDAASEIAWGNDTSPRRGGLGPPDDAVENPDRLDRVGSGRRLGGQHHRVRAVQDRVGDVRDLGARRSEIRDHGLEHLGRDDDRRPRQAGFPEDLLLGDRDLLDRHLDPEVAARHHDRPSSGQDLVEAAQGLRPFQLGDDLGVGPELVDDLPDLEEVGRRPHERDPDVVDAVPEAELEVLAVLRGEDRQPDRRARKVHALVVADHAARGDATHDVLAPHLLDVQRDPAVVDQDAIPDLHVLPEAAVGDARPLGRPLHRLRRQGEPVAAAQHHAAAGERAQADLRPLEVLEDRDGLPDPDLHGSDALDRLLVLRVGAVGEVQAGDVHPGAGHLLDDALGE